VILEAQAYKKSEHFLKRGVRRKAKSDFKKMAQGYTFGFNGQEKVNEIAGTGNHNTALFWEYDTRLGRRWNLDPVWNGSESRYATFGNNPVAFSDVLGDYKTKVGAYLAWGLGGFKGHVSQSASSSKYKGEWGIISGGHKVAYKGTGVGTAWSQKFQTSDATSNTLGKIGNFFRNLDWVVEGSGNISFGAQIKGGISAWGFKGTAELNLASFEVVGGKAGFHSQNPNEYDYNYVGKDDTWKFSQKVGVEGGLAVGPSALKSIQAGVNYENNWSTYAGGYGEREGDDPNDGFHWGIYRKGEGAIKKATASQIEQAVTTIARNTANKLTGSKVGVKDNFIGIDLGGSAAVLIGVKGNIKLGFNY
jgi:hypothetical protein